MIQFKAPRVILPAWGSGRPVKKRHSANLSLLGFISTTALGWRKEAREAQEAKLELEKTRLELEKMRAELESRQDAERRLRWSPTSRMMIPHHEEAGSMLP